MERASQWLRDALALGWRLGAMVRVAECLDELAILAAQTSDLHHAARLFGAADALHAQLGAPVAGAGVAERDAQLQHVRTALSTSEFNEAYGEGAGMPVGQAVDCALRVTTGP
jgi:hypothetical protein